MSDSDDGISTDLFQEPENFFKPAPEPTFATHTLLSGKELKLRLVGHNPLWVGQRSIPVSRFPSLLVLLFGCPM